jgi:hypothetical protein
MNKNLCSVTVLFKAVWPGASVTYLCSLVDVLRPLLGSSPDPSLPSFLHSLCPPSASWHQGSSVLLVSVPQSPELWSSVGLFLGGESGPEFHHRTRDRSAQFQCAVSESVRRHCPRVCR